MHQNQRMRMASHVLNTGDILEEILVRVPPEFISKPLLVSKQWFELIRSSSFRDHYIGRWRHALPLVGLKGFYVRNTSFLQTPISKSNLARSTWDDARRFLSTTDDDHDCHAFQQRDYFIDSSYNGILLIGRQIHPFTYIVWNPFAKKHYQLPPPRENYEFASLAFAAEYQDSGLFRFLIFRAKSCISWVFENLLQFFWVQTFSSETGRWEETTLPRSRDLMLSPQMVGTVIRGVVYWPALDDGVVIFDPSHHLVSSVSSPPSSEICLNGGLGASSDGVLQYAQMSRSDMRIWILQSDHRWNLRYAFDLETTWKEHLTPGQRYYWGFCFLSFLPQNSEYAFVKLENKIFLLHLPSQNLEQIHYHCDASSYKGQALPYFKWACPWPSFLANTSM